MRTEQLRVRAQRHLGVPMAAVLYLFARSLFVSASTVALSAWAHLRRSMSSSDYLAFGILVSAGTVFIFVSAMVASWVFERHVRVLRRTLGIRETRPSGVVRQEGVLTPSIPASDALHQIQQVLSRSGRTTSLDEERGILTGKVRGLSSLWKRVMLTVKVLQEADGCQLNLCTETAGIPLVDFQGVGLLAFIMLTVLAQPTTSNDLLHESLAQLARRARELGDQPRSAAMWQVPPCKGGSGIGRGDASVSGKRSASAT